MHFSKFINIHNYRNTFLIEKAIVYLKYNSKVQPEPDEVAKQITSSFSAIQLIYK